MKNILFATLLVLAGCTTPKLQSVPYEGELKILHRQASERAPEDYASVRLSENQNKRHRISEIAIQRDYNFGSAPVYLFVAQNDGSVRYHGEANVNRKGDHTGKVYEWQFDQLAQFIHDSGYAELKPSYDSGVTCQATVYTSIVCEGKRKVVRNYGRAGPASLWAAEQLMDNLMEAVRWDEMKK